MNIIVQKFGGTSVASIERLRIVAEIVKREYENGKKLVVVVSAMAGETDKLVNWVRQANRLYDTREYDVVVSSGEQVTSGLLALCLQNISVPARSVLGWQAPIYTNDIYSKASIDDIKHETIHKALEQNQVVVVPGFQGISYEGRVTTLGRGGSDTSAVALAASLKAERCDIFTDVDGVYTCDPRLVPKAQKLGFITYEEMLELASLGAKVLHPRSVALAKKYNVELQVLSSFKEETGTFIVDEDKIVEQGLISGVAYSKNDAKITIRRVTDKPGIAGSIFGPLAAAGVNVDMIVQNISEDGLTTDMTFTVEKTDLERTIGLLEEHRFELGYADLNYDDQVAKISIVGVGMKSHAGVAQMMFKALGEKGINIEVITTSEIKVSVLIAIEYLELAVRALHTTFGLDA